MLSLIASALIAQTCTSDAGGGQVIDLGTLCHDWETPAQANPATAQPTSPSFPAWLLGPPENARPHLTGQADWADSALFIYQNRWVKEFSRWPYTAHDNHAEWTFLDCRTGALIYREHPMVGTSDDLYVPPSENGAPDAYRAMCQAGGVGAGF